MKNILFRLFELLIAVLCYVDVANASVDSFYYLKPQGDGSTQTFTMDNSIQQGNRFSWNDLGGSWLTGQTAFTISMAARIDPNMIDLNSSATLFSFLDKSVATGCDAGRGQRILETEIRLFMNDLQFTVYEQSQNFTPPYRKFYQMIGQWMHYIVSYSFTTKTLKVSLYKYSTFEEYLSLTNVYTNTYTSLTQSNVELAVGSFYCKAANHQKLFGGQIKNIYYISAQQVSDFSPRQLYLLRYGGYTQVLGFYPVDEKTGEIIVDQISGNDGTLGLQVDSPFIGYESSNPSRTTDTDKLPILDYSHFISFQFPFMSTLGEEVQNFFISFWVNSYFSQAQSNPLLLFSFYQTQLWILSSTQIQFVNNQQTFTYTKSSALSDSWQIHTVSFRPQIDFTLNGSRYTEIEIIQGFSDTFETISFNCSGCDIRPIGQIVFGGQKYLAGGSTFTIQNIILGVGSLIDRQPNSNMGDYCLIGIARGLKSFCISCQNGYYLINGTCVTNTVCQGYGVTKYYLDTTLRVCNKLCSSKCAACSSDGLSCTTCNANRISAPYCYCSGTSIDQDGQPFCLASSKPQNFGFSFKFDFNQNPIRLQQQQSITQNQDGNRTLIFSSYQLKNFDTSYNRVDIDAISRLDIIGQGFSLNRQWIGKNSSTTMSLYPLTHIFDLHTTHIGFAAPGYSMNQTVDLSTDMSTPNSNVGNKSQTISIQSLGPYSKIELPLVVAYIQGFKYVLLTNTNHLLIDLTIESITQTSCVLRVTTLNQVGLSQITFSLGSVRPGKLVYHPFTADLTTSPLNVSNNQMRSQKYTSTTMFIQPGTPVVYGFSGFDVTLGQSQRLTLDLKAKQQTDYLSVDYTVSSWSDQITNKVSFSALWLMADCTYSGDSGSSCKRSYLETDNQNSATTVCSTGFWTLTTNPTFPGCRSCVNQASNCTAEMTFNCLSNQRKEQYCTNCHYSCSMCQMFDEYCVSCSSTVRYLASIGNFRLCLCMSGYYESGPGDWNCTGTPTYKCHQSCQTCNGINDFNCLTCDSNNNRIYNTSTFRCDCIPGYFDMGSRSCMLLSESCLFPPLQQIVNFINLQNNVIITFPTSTLNITNTSTSLSVSDTVMNQIYISSTTQLPFSIGTVSTSGTTQFYQQLFQDNKQNNVVFVGVYNVQKSIENIQFKHTVYGSLQTTYNLGLFRTDKDWWQAYAFVSSGDITHTALYNLILVPQFAGTKNTYTYNSTIYQRVDKVSGMFMDGQVFQILFTETNGVDRNVASLTTIITTFLKIINDARLSCCDVDLTALIKTMDARFDRIFLGVKNIKSNLTVQDGRISNLVFSAPFQDLNTIRTNYSSSAVQYNWGFETTEVTKKLGSNTGSIATRQYDNFYFNGLRLDGVNYIQLQNEYSTGFIMTYKEYQLTKKINNQITYNAYIKQTKVNNLYPILNVLTVLRDQGNFDYYTFSNNKRSLQVFQNLDNYTRAYQIIFFSSQGYQHPQSELQMIFENFVGILEEARRQRCMLPNIATLGSFLKSESFSTTAFTKLTRSSFTYGNFQMSNLQFTSIKVRTNFSDPLYMPFSSDRAYAYPGFFGRAGTVFPTLDINSGFSLLILPDQVSWIQIDLTLSIGSTTIVPTTQTFSNVDYDNQNYNIQWVIWQGVSQKAYVVIISDMYKQLNIFFRLPKITTSLTSSNEFINVSNITTASQVYFYFMSGSDTLATNTLDLVAFNTFFLKRIISQARHWVNHKCTAYNYKTVCTSCATNRNGICDTTTMLEDNLNSIPIGFLFIFIQQATCDFYRYPFDDWTVFTSSYLQSNPVSSYSNLLGWASANSTYMNSSLSTTPNSCVQCGMISTNLAPGVYLPYTSYTTGIRTDIFGFATSYWTYLSLRNFIMGASLNNVNEVQLMNIFNPTYLPDMTVANNIQETTTYINRIFYYSCRIFNSSAVDEVFIIVMVPDPSSSVAVTTQITNAFTSTHRINVKGASRIYITMTVINKVAGYDPTSSYIGLRDELLSRVQSYRQCTNYQCFCRFPSGNPSSGCVPQSGDIPTCDYSCQSCEIAQLGPKFCLSCPPNSFRTLTAGQCLCSWGYYDYFQQPICRQCDPTCNGCKDRKLCIQCASNNNRVLDPFSQECVCAQGFYDTGVLVCQACNSLCLTCANNSTQCTSCSTGQTLDFLKGPTCTCSDGYFLNSTTKLCDQCHYSCQLCFTSGAYGCSQCLVGNYLRTFNAVTSACQCNDGYYDPVVLQCASCLYTCLKCNITAGGCTECRTGVFRTLSNNKCDCNTGYYDDGSSFDCKQCYSKCYTCTQTATQCSGCDLTLYRILDQKTCICQVGYYESSGVCNACDPTCLTCSILSTNCTSCNSTLNRTLSSSSCPCVQGYQDYGDGICKVVCQFSCDTCLNFTQLSTCLTCPVNSNRQYDPVSQQCDCLPGYLETGTWRCRSCNTISVRQALRAMQSTFMDALIALIPSLDTTQTIGTNNVQGSYFNTLGGNILTTSLVSDQIVYRSGTMNFFSNNFGPRTQYFTYSKNNVFVMIGESNPGTQLNIRHTFSTSMTCQYQTLSGSQWDADSFVIYVMQCTSASNVNVVHIVTLPQRATNSRTAVITNSQDVKDTITIGSEYFIYNFFVTTGGSLTIQTISDQLSKLVPTISQHCCYPNLKELVGNFLYQYRSINQLMKNPLFFTSTTGQISISQTQSNGMFSSAGGMIIETDKSSSHAYSHNSMMLGYMGSDPNMRASYITMQFSEMFLLAVRPYNLQYFKINLNYNTQNTYESVTLSSSNYKAYCSRNYGGSVSTNLMIITQNDNNILTEFVATGYTKLTGISNVKRIYVLLFGTNDGSQVPNATFQSILDKFVGLIQSTIAEGCNAEPALHKILKEIDQNRAQLESAMPTNKFAFTDGIGGFNITNGGSNMFIVGNVFSLNGSSIPYSDQQIRRLDDQIDGKYFTYKSDYFFLASMKIQGQNYFQIYSKWGITVNQFTWQFKKINDMFEYVGYLRCINQTTRPSHYTMIILKNRYTLTRQTDPQNNIDGKDKVIGLEGTQYIHYLFFASTKIAYSYSQLQAIFEKFVDMLSAASLRPVNPRCTQTTNQEDCSQCVTGRDLTNNYQCETISTRKEDFLNPYGGVCSRINLNNLPGVITSRTTDLTTGLQSSTASLQTDSLNMNGNSLSKMFTNFSPKSPWAQYTSGLSFATSNFGNSTRIVTELLSQSVLINVAELNTIDWVMVASTYLHQLDGMFRYIGPVFYYRSGVQFQLDCQVTFGSLSYSNIFECFIREVIQWSGFSYTTIGPAYSSNMSVTNMGRHKYFIYFTFQQDPSQTILNDSQITTFAQKVSDTVVDSRFNPEDCYCSGLNRDDKCNCLSGYYDLYNPKTKTQDCQQCDFSCGECYQTSSQCMNCAVGSNRNYNTTTYSCPCKAGYFEMQVSVCASCNAKCLNCAGTTENDCISCNSTLQRFLSNSSCLCADGYFDDGINVACALCDPNCLKCSGTSTQCTACYPNNNRVIDPKTKQCVCDSHFFTVGSMLCSPCSYACVSCKDLSTTCTACDTNLKRQQSSTCQCLDGYYDSGVQQCSQCSYTCNTCATSATNCLTCLSSANRYLNNSSCLCTIGYFENGVSNCGQCSYQCLSCETNSNKCTSCDTTQLRTYVQTTNTCSCNLGYFDDGSSKICQVCDYSCRTCSGSSVQCLTCPTGSFRVLNPTTKACECPLGYQDSPNNPICIVCSSSCYKCGTKPDQCTACDPNPLSYRATLTDSKCPCKIGYYDNGASSQCQACGNACQTCVEQSSCLTCKLTGTNRFDKKDGTCPCLVGYYDNLKDAVCGQCHFTCAKCEVGSGIYDCTACDSSVQHRYSSKQLCVCMDGYFEAQQQVCQQCNQNCQTCSLSADNCITCLSSTRTTSQCVCLLGYRETGTQDCEQCDWRCSRCDNQKNICTECRGDRTNFPFCTCPTKLFDIPGQQYCTDCAPQCDQCANTPANCLRCSPGRRDPPICSCGDGRYNDPATGECSDCSITCATCDNKQCFTCNANRVLTNKKCLCPDGGVSHQGTPWCGTCEATVPYALMADTLDVITIQFDFAITWVSTNTWTQQETCQNIFDSKLQTKLGAGCKCYIDPINPMLFQIVLGNEPTIVQNDLITFQNTQPLFQVISMPCSKPIAKIVPPPMNEPGTPATPSASLSGPQGAVSLCTPVTLTLVNFQNTGNRPLKNIVWSLTSAKPEDSTVSTNLAVICANAANSLSLTIPMLTMGQFGLYGFQASFQNYLGGQSLASMNVSTLSTEAPDVFFTSDEQTYFYVWQSTFIQGNFRHYKCDTGVLEEVFDAMKYNWTEIVSKRNPPTGNPLILAPVTGESDGTAFTNTLSILPYQASINTKYTIQLEVTLTNKLITSKQTLEIQYIQSDLQGMIVGGNRMQSFSQPAVVVAQMRDPDVQVSPDPDLYFSWRCINLNDNSDCTDSVGKPLSINSSSLTQSWRSKYLAPYTTYNFFLNATKGTRQLIVSAIIIVIEMDLPVLTTELPAGFLSRRVSLNEMINFILKPDSSQNPDELRYSCSIIYDFADVAVFRFEYLKVQFKIWSYFVDTGTKTDISIKLASKDPYFYMPSVSTIKLSLNLPPDGGVLIVRPAKGDALSTNFKFVMQGYTDVDSPITYKFQVYQSKGLMDSDIIMGQDINKIVLSDFQTEPTFSTLLPSPQLFPNGTYAESLLLVVTISDALGALRNVTQLIPIRSIQQQIKDGTNIKIILDIIYKQLKLQTALADQTMLSSMVIVAQELSQLYPTYSNLTQMVNTVKNLYTKLKSLQGKLSSELMEEPLMQAISALAQTGFQTAQTSTSTTAASTSTTSSSSTTSTTTPSTSSTTQSSTSTTTPSSSTTTPSSTSSTTTSTTTPSSTTTSTTTTTPTTNTSSTTNSSTNKPDTSVVNDLKSQLKDVSKLFDSQSQSSSNLITQRTQANGADLKTDRKKDALDNTIKSTAGVMDSIFSNIDCSLPSPLDESAADESVQQNQDKMMKDVMSMTQGVTSTLTSGTLPNEKPTYVGGSNVASSASTLTPAKMAQFLVTKVKPSIFMKPDTSKPDPTTDLNGTRILEEYFIEDPYAQHELFALFDDEAAVDEISENQNRKYGFQEEYIRRIMQSTLNTSAQKTFSVSTQKYAKNPYNCDPSFQSQFTTQIPTNSSSNSTTTNSTRRRRLQSNVSVSSSKPVEGASTYDPSITVMQNGKATKLSSMNGQKIGMPFPKPAGIDPAAMGCMQMNAQTSAWGGSCTLVPKTNAVTKEVSYNCECTLLSTTTIMSEVTELFKVPGLEALTGGNPLDILASMQFWTYAIFYILLFLSGSFILMCVLGFYRDRTDLIEAIEDELKDLPRDKDVRAIEALIPGHQVDEDDEDQVLENPEDFKVNMTDKNMAKKLAAASLKGGPVVVAGDKVVDADEQQRLEEEQEADKHRQLIQQNLKENQITVQKAKRTLHSHNILVPGQNNIKKKAKNFANIMDNLFKDSPEDETPLQRLKKLNFKLVMTGILYLHEVISIYRFWMIESPRPVRFTVVYIKIIFMMTTQSVFNGSLTMVQNIALGIIAGQVGAIMVRGLQGCLQGEKMVKVVGMFSTLITTLGMIGIILIMSALMAKSDADMWAVSFLVSLVMDQIVMQCIQIVVKIVIYPWVRKQTQDENGYLIAHLIFFLIAVPEMNEFFYEEG